MERHVKLSFWSDEDRWFVPRKFGLGYSLNLKFVAKRLGWIKSTLDEPAGGDRPSSLDDAIRTESREDRLRRQIEASRYEDGS
jgi:hypothetical protein